MKFFTSTISAFAFMNFMDKAPSRWGKKGGKDFGCENYLRKESFYDTSKRLTTNRPVLFFKKLSNKRKII